MIKIILKRSQNRLQMVSIQEDPTPGSWGDLQLLMDQYRVEEKTFLTTEKGKRMLFNYNWLLEMQARFGPLRCEYCGKPNLVAYHWSQRPKRKRMATTDHFFPKGKYPHLVENKENLVVACDRCNTRKGTKHWPWHTIEHPFIIRDFKAIKKPQNASGTIVAEFNLLTDKNNMYDHNHCSMSALPV